MLRDYKLARSTYELVQPDFKSEKAWRYWGVCCEMNALTTLILATPASLTSPPGSSSGGGDGGAKGPAAGGRNGSPAMTANTTILPYSSSSSSSGATTPGMENLDANLDQAYTTSLTRLHPPSPYQAARALLPAIELLLLRRTPQALEQAAAWAQRILEDRVLGPVGAVLLTERLAACFAVPRRGADGDVRGRCRKAAFWALLAAEGWVRLEMPVRASEALARAEGGYAALGPGEESRAMAGFLGRLRGVVQVLADGVGRVDGEALLRQAAVDVEGSEHAEGKRQAEELDVKMEGLTGGKNLKHMQQAVSALTSSNPINQASMAENNGILPPPLQLGFPTPKPDLNTSPGFGHRKTQSLNPPPNDFLHAQRERPPTAANQTLRSYSPSPSRSDVPTAAPDLSSEPATERLPGTQSGTQAPQLTTRIAEPLSASFDPLGAAQGVESVPFAPAPTPAQVLRRERGHGRAVSAAASMAVVSPTDSARTAADSPDKGTSAYGEEISAGQGETQDTGDDREAGIGGDDAARSEVNI